MSKKQIKEFLEDNPGYAKKGSETLMSILEAKGISLASLSKEDIKEILRLKIQALKMQKAASITKILTYDIETSLVEAFVWSSGKQYVGHNNITTETQIITVAYKWMGSNTVQHLKWNMKKKSDKKLMKAFLVEYNKADMVIGFNNNSFDNKIVNSRAMKWGLDVNTHVKSYDIMRQMKRVFRLPSYSMAYISRYLKLAGKLDYGGGIRMWHDIQWGGKKAAKDAMKLMIKYNVQDVALTEQVFYKLRPYLGTVIHKGVMQGKGKMSCPECGGSNVKHYRTQVTAAGAISHVMKCKDDKVKFKVSNTEYLKTL